MSVQAGGAAGLRAATIVAMIILFETSAALSAQWLSIALPETPRTADGRANLTAPAPRSDDGKQDQTWMDDSGLPHSDALRTTERFRRRDFGHLDLQITFDDVKTFTMPWSVNLTFNLLPDTELIESICENELDGKHMVGK